MVAQSENDKYRGKIVDLETAIEVAGFGKYHVLLILVCGTCMSISIFESMGVSFILPVAQYDLDLDTFDKGMISGAVFWGMILSFHVWGFCADFFGRKPILLITFFSTWSSSFLSSLAPDFLTFTILRFFTGIFLCGLSSVVYPYLSEFLPARSRSFIMTCTCAFIALGFLVIPALAWLILPLDIDYDLGFVKLRSWRLLIIVMGLPCFLAAFILMRYTESPKFLMSKGKKERALNVLRRMYAINKNKSEKDYPIKDLQYEIQQNEENNESLDLPSDRKSAAGQFFKLVWRQTVTLFLPPYLITTLLFCTLQFGVYGTSRYRYSGRFNESLMNSDPISLCSMFNSTAGMYLWIPDILNTMTTVESANSYGLVCAAIESAKSGNLTETKSVVTNSMDTTVYKSTLIIGCCYVLSYATIGSLIRFLGQRKVLVSGLFVSGISGIGMYFTSSDVLVRIFMTLFVIFSGTNVSVLNATIVDLYPTNLRAMAISLALTSGRLGTSVVGNVIGILIERNCTVAIIGAGSVILVCAFLCLFISNPVNQRKSVDRNENSVTTEQASN